MDFNYNYSTSCWTIYRTRENKEYRWDFRWRVAFALAICLSVGIIGGIVGAVAIIGGFLEGGNVLEEVKGYEISNEIKSIDIKISADDFEIIEGDRFFVESDIKIEGGVGEITVDFKAN